jgi:hypothetical protein
MRTFTLWLLGADGIFLLLYGLLSLLMVPRAVGEVYLSSTRWLYGVIPTVLGTVSLISSIWVCVAGIRGVPDAHNPTV